MPTQLPIQAIPYNTVPAPTTPWVNPGTYTVKLTVDGKSYTQPIVGQAGSAREDAGARDAAGLLADEARCTTVRSTPGSPRLALGAVRQQLAKVQAQGAVAQSLAAFGQKAAALEGTPPAAGGRTGRPGRRGPRAAAVGGPPADATDTLWAVSASLGAVMNAMQAADVAPTANTLAAVTAAQQNAARVMARWTALRTVDLPALNAQLKAAGLTPLTIE